ncbi:MAG: PhzF family phenazine biosynthesis protein [Clostridium sp.]|jgi:PhzF family phenazine biosynthesis protein|uniref:PhzF family phenazine biosynthesis protein n=1 Tax=Clostridium sp. TaxID=1506 RepID=UPI0025BC200F|nr:PhzF family phenazine biosynthesis protein [Clostridium sp.]MCH3965423.1 PhzF family phenazine biosynthesis protein [Clostridium sp.]MCI1717296.1 PhzF family phenazine biosynthesis protein [Clostridium sp.]MCI1801636.1 PhzF family phenazine biosynthesis protein [Clostridium sp.]MCI1815482.1 PhzF family phenazine biosynthesis protein [Clostridium sp.]MCI1872385.1 PhzF family phenazine biosynthesis protein [Clostridium sp.]
MRMPIYQVDAFTNELFRGNPAAVCPLEEWIDDNIMQKIAKENNLSETAFFIKKGDMYELRWFTPEFEIDLCGHATLAAAYVIFQYLEKDLNEISFDTKSGKLKVIKKATLLTMVFPSREGNKCDITKELVEALGKKPLELYKSRDYMAVFEKEEDIINLNPDMEKLKKINAFGIIVTSKGNDIDFVSRYFIPDSVIGEDPVTGSAHCTLIPYWKKVLNKDKFLARQLSDRSGILYCRDLGDKVEISGEAAFYLEGYINV